MLLFERRPGLRTTAIAGLLLAAAVLTKIEGIHLAVLGLLAGALALLPHLRALGRAGRSRLPRLGHLAPAGVGVAAAAVLLAFWLSGIEDRMGNDFAELFSIPSVVRGLFERSGSILRAVAEKSLNKWEWGRFWLAAPLVLAAGAPALRKRSARPILLFLLLAPLVPFGGYLITSRVPANLVASTWDRFLLQTSPFWLVLLAICARQAWGRSRPARRQAGRLAAELRP
jgi:hypothetical protein